MKKSLSIILFTSLLFFSCATNKGLLSFLKNKGELMYYLMPVSCKGKNIDYFSADFTFYVTKGNVDSETIANYSLVPKNPNVIDNAKVGFVADGEKIYFKDDSIIFKELYKKKQVLVRFSARIDKDDTEVLLNKSGAIKFFIETSGFYEELESKELQKHIDELRLII